MEEQVRDIGTVFIDAWNSFLTAVPGLLMALLIVVIGIFIARWVAGLFGRRILSRMEDPLMGRFLVTTLRILLVAGALLLGLRAAGLSGIAGALFGALGASAVVLGFAFRAYRGKLHLGHHSGLQPTLRCERHDQGGRPLRQGEGTAV